MLCQLSYAPSVRDHECSLGNVQRRALAGLFAILAIALGAIAVGALLQGGRALVVAFAAAAVALWLGDLARRALAK